MTSYSIPFTQVVTGHLTVEADTLDEAVQKAEMEGLPGLMFLNHDYPDEAGWTGGWEIDKQALIDNYPGEDLYAEEDEED